MELNSCFHYFFHFFLFQIKKTLLLSLVKKKKTKATCMSMDKLAWSSFVNLNSIAFHQLYMFKYLFELKKCRFFVLFSLGRKIREWTIRIRTADTGTTLLPLKRCKYTISVSFDRLMIERGQSRFTYLVIIIQLFEYENWSINYQLYGWKLLIVIYATERIYTRPGGVHTLEFVCRRFLIDSSTMFFPYLHMNI